MNENWDELRAMKPGTVVGLCSMGIEWNGKEWHPIHGRIMRSTGSLTAYIGFPMWHPFAKMANYERIPLDVHGGLTFGDEGTGPKKDAVAYWPAGFFWIGWDYAHAYDRTFYDDDLRDSYPDAAKMADKHKWAISEKKWVSADVKVELEQAMRDFLPLFVYGWIVPYTKYVIERETAVFRHWTYQQSSRFSSRLRELGKQIIRKAGLKNVSRS